MAHGEHVTVMEWSVEDGGGDNRVCEHRSPLADAAVAGQKDGGGPSSDKRVTCARSRTTQRPFKPDIDVGRIVVAVHQL